MEDLLLSKFSKTGNGPDFYNCWNWCVEVAKRMGFFLPAFSDWIEEISCRENVINKFKKSDFIKLEKPEAGCIVTLRLVPGCINHMGIVLEDKKRFAQIRKIGPSIERLDNSKWVHRIEGFYRYVSSN